MSPPTHLTRLTPLIAEAATVGGQGDLGRILQSLVTEAKEATGASYAALGIVGDHGVLSDFLYAGLTEKEAEQIGHPPVGNGVLGTLIRDKETLVLDAISEHPDSVGFPDHHPPMSSFLGVPVTVGGDAFGNLYLTEKDGGFDEADVELVQALSRIAGTAVQTAKLQQRLRTLAVVEDRERIARDLHDTVIQDLFAVGLALQSVASTTEDEAVAGPLTMAVDTLDKSVTTLRNYVFGLKDPSRPMRLSERLQEVIERMGAVYPARVTLKISGDPVGPWAEDAVLLVSEAVSNALRHSSGSEVGVRVLESAEEIVIEVTDDGEGFDAHEISRGLGLNSIRVRAASHGGSAEIVSRPGEGTTVVARFPRGASSQG